MKQGLPWLIGGIAIGVIVFFLINMTVPSQYQPKKFNISAEQCGETLEWSYCSNGQMCKTRCNSCNCEQPSCSQDAFCPPEGNSEGLPGGVPSTTEGPTNQLPPPPPSF